MPGGEQVRSDVRDWHSLVRRVERLERKRPDVGVPIRRAPAGAASESKYDQDVISRIRSTRLRFSSDMNSNSPQTSSGLLTVNDGDFGLQVSGASSGTITSGTLGVSALNLARGTTATGRAAITGGLDPVSINSGRFFAFDNTDVYSVAGLIQIPVISTVGVQEFVTYVGGFGGALTAAPTDGMFFRMGNGGNFRCVTRASGVETDTSSGVPLDTSSHELFVYYDAAGPDVQFYIDGTLVATNTTNIPANATNLLWGMQIRGVAGTNQRSVAVDWLSVDLPETRTVYDLIP